MSSFTWNSHSPWSRCFFFFVFFFFQIFHRGCVEFKRSHPFCIISMIRGKNQYTEIAENLCQYLDTSLQPGRTPSPPPTHTPTHPDSSYRLRRSYITMYHFDNCKLEYLHVVAAEYSQSTLKGTPVCNSHSGTV